MKVDQTKNIQTEINKTQSALENRIITYVEQNKQQFISISHAIHEHPEIGNEEVYAQGLLTSLLEEAGFQVEKGVAGHATAFLARKQVGEKTVPTIGYLAEYDALPGLGHACGHNIIGTTSVLAAIALGETLQETGGEVVVLGTPAEEGGPNGSAKGSFVTHNLLTGIDACMMVHPFSHNRITGTTLAVIPLDFEFIGKAAHAAAAPEEGINALDSVIQLFNGINALRQHVTDDVRIHGIITHGGDAPNIVPEYAKARFYIRASTRSTCREVTERIKQIAQGAALMTGATVNLIAFQNEVDDLVLNRTFDGVFQAQMERFGYEVDTRHQAGLGSTDAGNISYVVPTIHPYIKIGSDELVCHTDAFREAAKSPEGDAAIIVGAKVLALTGFTLMTNEAVLAEIKQEFSQQKQGLS
ncbi:M20 family peptidase [Brevibacillus laterosporus]|nr:M20 family metallopeptidase [Brevibacillus laterosporus]TPG88586.1 M20 family peptidase [Brevibacillus laterosporus]